MPVEAPLGTIDFAQQDLVIKSTSTVGLPLESRTSLAFIFLILKSKNNHPFNQELERRLYLNISEAIIINPIKNYIYKLHLII